MRAGTAVFASGPMKTRASEAALRTSASLSLSNFVRTGMAFWLSGRRRCRDSTAVNRIISLSLSNSARAGMSTPALGPIFPKVDAAAHRTRAFVIEHAIQGRNGSFCIMPDAPQR